MLSNLIQQGLCTGCGICISEDSTNKAYMHVDEYGFLVPEVGHIDGTVQQQMMRVCPFSPSNKENSQDEDTLGQELFGHSKFDEKIGFYDKLYVGYAKQYRVSSSSGGLATYIFNHLLQHNIVDALFVVNEQNGQYGYNFVTDIQDIDTISKTRYIPVTMEELFLKIDNIEGKVAVCGVGCFLKAIRLKQHYYPQYKQKIALCIGIICGGLKSEFYTDYLSQCAGIKGGFSRQQYRIKDSLSSASDYSYGAIDNSSDEFKTIKMSSLGDMWGTGLFKANACDFCDDVTTELADISLGDAWLSPYNAQGLGNSIVITRNSYSSNLIDNGIKDLELSLEPISLEQIIESQKGSFTHRQKGLGYRLKLTAKKGLIVPKKRKRLLVKIDFSTKLVQKQRMAIRLASLSIWKQYREASLFEQEIQNHRKKLKRVTKINHSLRKRNLIS